MNIKSIDISQANPVDNYRGRFMNNLSVTEDFRDAELSDTRRASSAIYVCVWEGASGDAFHTRQWSEKSHFNVVSLHLGKGPD